MKIISTSNTTRLDTVKRRLQQEKMDAVLISSRENNRYFSGFSGTESWLLITAQENMILVDFRYLEQTAIQCSGFQIIDYTSDRNGILAETLQAAGCQHLGVEEDDLSWGLSCQIKNNLPQIHLIPAQGWLDDIRAVKDEAEVAIITRAVQIAESALEEILQTIRPGQTEIEIAAMLEHAMRMQGASGASFTTIVASGPRSAMPHGVASDRRVKAGDAIVIDFGCIWQGYCSDMTRTVFLGEPDPMARQIYQIVLEAQIKAAAALKAGMTGQEGDQVARKIITDAGFGAEFGHGLGHGVGLAIHESPRLAQSNRLLLQPGHIVTVEPGIYLPGKFGVRIEDMLLIQPDGAINLNSMSKDLTVLAV